MPVEKEDIPMKRTISLLLCLLLTACLAAGYAEENGEGAPQTYDMMQVVNCQEWVSLREFPDTKSDRLYKVPLNDMVLNCYAYDERFICCEYQGIRGYIAGEYLRKIDPWINWEQDGCQVVAYSRGNGEDEIMDVVCYAGDGEPVWTYQTVANGIGQYSKTYAFMGGTHVEPKVMVYNSDVGLSMLKLWDGTAEWTLSRETFSLGSGNCAAVDDNGIIYIAGSDGPTPVAISPDGRVLWQAKIDDPNVFWPYEIEPRMDDIAVRYGSAEMEHDQGSFYEVILDMTGTVESIELVCPG